MLLAGLAAGLPATSFYSGDSGLKLVAARNAIDHPTRPFEIDLPRIGAESTPLVDPMVTVHGGHAHALQSLLFPVLTAPLIAIFGIRGAYVLPALGFVGLIVMLDVMRQRIVREASFGLLMVMALAANPAFFYALEFWEHSVAVALLAASTALCWHLTEKVNAWIDPGVIFSGVLGGIAILLRPEAAWYVLGLAVVLNARRWGSFGGGALLVLLPVAIANYAHFGNPLGPHATANLAPLQSDWLISRWARITDWIWPSSGVAAVGLVLLIGVRLLEPVGVDQRIQQVIALSGGALVALLSAAGSMPRVSFWQGFPVAVLAFVPVSHSAGARRLAIITGVALTGIVLTATHNGGAQWGSRFLLVVVPAVMVLAARAATLAAGDGRWRMCRLALIAVILSAGLMTSRAAYRELRGAKRTYAQLVDTVAAATSPGRVILTNVWWLDQVAASLFESQQFLYAGNLQIANKTLQRLASVGTPEVTLVWSAESDGVPLPTAVNGTCFKPASTRDIPEGQLRLMSVACAR